MTLQVFLNPGDCWMGSCRPGQLTTILGSCISLVACLPPARWVGVCHAVLPTRGKLGSAPLSGRFVDEAFMIFAQELIRYGATLQQCELQLYGGGDMFFVSTSNDAPAMFRVGQQNLHMALNLLGNLNAVLAVQDFGGNCYRHLRVDLSNGRTQLDKNGLPQRAISTVSSLKAGRYDRKN